MRDEATFRVKAGLAEMLKGGVIMDVVDAEQAKIAEDAGACAVMALERVPADIRRDGGVARMSDPEMIRGIQEAVTIPVMAKARIGHFAEARVLEALEVDYIDESEVLTPADEAHHIDKWPFKVPFVCGATNLGEALRRVGEGAAMIRSKGEAGTGDIVEAVRHLRTITGEIRRLQGLDDAELATTAKEHGAPLDLVRATARGRPAARSSCSAPAASRRRPTPRSSCTSAPRASSSAPGIFKSEDPETRAAAIVEATTHFQDWDRVLKASEGLGEAMQSLEARKLDDGPGPRRAAAGEPAAGRRPSASSRCRATSRRTARCSRASAPTVREVRVPADLDGLDGLVMPGGESTTMTLGIEREGLAEPLRAFHAAGRPIFGTCAGLIMLDREHLGIMDIVAARNAFGRQVHSFEEDLDLGPRGRPGARGLHPRAAGSPSTGRASRCSPRSTVIRSPRAQGAVLAISFHPELSGDARLHERFLATVRRLRDE